MISITASLYKMTKDSDGEVKIVFCVPQVDASKALQIPEQTLLTLNVEVQDAV